MVLCRAGSMLWMPRHCSDMVTHFPVSSKMTAVRLSADSVEVDLAPLWRVRGVSQPSRLPKSSWSKTKPTSFTKSAISTYRREMTRQRPRYNRWPEVSSSAAGTGLTTPSVEEQPWCYRRMSEWYSIDADSSIIWMRPSAMQPPESRSTSKGSWPIGNTKRSCMRQWSRG